MPKKKAAIRTGVDDTDADTSQLIDGKYSIKDLIDFNRLSEIFESFSKATGFTTGMLSYPDLEVLIGTGWRDICAQYHRACPESLNLCKLSNRSLLGGLTELRELNISQCENGLVDGATPVIVRGKHLASLTTGQVLFAKPDVVRFSKQAERFGYDVDAYLLALSQVPVVTPAQLMNALAFLSGIAVEIAERSLEHLKAKELTVRLKEEVAERKQTEKSLRETERRYQALVEQIPAIIYTDSAEQFSQTLYISPQLKTLTGYDPEEWKADNDLWLKFFEPDERKRALEEYQRAIESGGQFNMEYRIPTKDSRSVWVRDKATLVRDQSGKPLYWQGIMLDISDQKQSEIALHESEEKYRSLVERASDGIAIIQDGVVKYINPRLAQMRGQSIEEILGTRFEIYIHPDERARLFERYRRRMAGEDVPATYETALVRVDQSKVSVELSAGIISFEEKPADLVLVRDISDRKQAQSIQEAIYKIAQAVISTAKMDELYYAIHRALEKILPVENFYIALYDPEKNLLSFPYFVDQYDTPSLPHTPGRGLTEYVLRTRKPLLATTEVFEDLLQKGEVESIGTDSVDWLGAPLNIGEKVVGVMVIQTYDDHVRLGKRDLEIMSFVSAQAAIAIERVRAEEATSRRTEELKALYDTSLDIISTHDLQTLLETIVERASRSLYATGGGLYLCEPERGEVRCVVSQHTPIDYTGTVLKYGEGAAGAVAKTGQPLIIDDYRVWSGRVAIFEQEKPFIAVLSAPIKWQGQVQGVLHVLDNREDRRFNEADLTLLSQFANQAAIAMENARLYEQVQRYANELEERVAERTAELSGRVAQVEELNFAMAELLEDLREANHSLEQTSQKLLAANAELETFAYSVSHDLKAPLRGIDGYSHLLMEQYAEKLDLEGKTFLQNIYQAAGHMGQIIDDLLTYSRLERRELTVEPVDPHALIEALLVERANEINQRNIQTVVDIPFKYITCDAEGLSHVLRNLLDNAIKFTQESPTARIEVGGQKTIHHTLIWVRDNGVGFDMKYQERIFEIFQRLYTSDAYPGTGIGLSIVRKVMERMGGRAWAESEPGKGATFYLEFPVGKSHRRESNP